MELLFLTLLLLASHGKIASCQLCSWKPAEASTLHGVVGTPAHFHVESLTPSQDGILYTWKLDGNKVAVYEYKSSPTPHFVVDEKPSSRLVANSKYVTNTKSEHNLTIKSLLASDDGKQVTLQREECSLATEYSEPITVLVSCCDPNVFGNDATMAALGSTSIKCDDGIVFSCNEMMYQAMNFTAVCQADSTWSIKQHTCASKLNQPNVAKFYQLSGGAVSGITIMCIILLLALSGSVIFSMTARKHINELEIKDRNESHSLRYRILEGRATLLVLQGEFSEAIKCLEEQHRLRKTNSSLLLMAECYLQLDDREGEAEQVICELRELLSAVRDVLDSADDLIEDRFYLRAMILLRIASDKYKSDTSMQPNDIVGGIHECVRKILGMVQEISPAHGKPHSTAYRYAMKYAKQMADDLNAVSDADHQKMKEHYLDCVREIKIAKRDSDYGGSEEGMEIQLDERVPMVSPTDTLEIISERVTSEK